MLIVLVLLLAFALFVGLVMELYKKCIRKDEASDLENRLVAFFLSSAFAAVTFLALDSSAVPTEIRFSAWLIVVFAVMIYILQLPACLSFWKPIVKKLLEKKLDD
jgi:ammonia channel protein AmtB